MTKSEAIKAAYGELYEKYEYRINKNDGYLNYKSEKVLKEIRSIVGEVELHPHYVYIFRPKSLSGIENNNGWTVLNKETYENLENSYYMWYNTNNGDWEVGDLDESFLQEYTHFQEIKLPPKPPIF